MMKRITIILWVLFCLCIPVEAKPPWKFIVHTGINLGTDVATSLTINRCMHDHGLGRCVGGDYGPFAAKESVRGGVALTITFASFKWKQWNEEEHKKHSLWWVAPDANAIFNAGVIARNANRHFPPKEKE